MKKVTLELSPDQYKELLRLVYAGDWMLEENDNYVLNDLVQTIFSKAGEIDAENMIDYNDNTQFYSPSPEMDEEMAQIIEEYEEASFWDNLISRLAERDVEKELGEAINTINEDELIDMMGPKQDNYLKEFEKNGLMNVEVRS